MNENMKERKKVQSKNFLFIASKYLSSVYQTNINENNLYKESRGHIIRIEVYLK